MWISSDSDCTFKGFSINQPLALDGIYVDNLDLIWGLYLRRRSPPLAV